MEHTIKITGVRLSDRVRKDGGRELAHFDCEVNGLLLANCLLYQTKLGGLSSNTPIIPDESSRYRSVVAIGNPSLRHALTQAARAAYDALTGKVENAAEPKATVTADSMSEDEARDRRDWPTFWASKDREDAPKADADTDAFLNRFTSMFPARGNP